MYGPSGPDRPWPACRGSPGPAALQRRGERVAVRRREPELFEDPDRGRLRGRLDGAGQHHGFERLIREGIEAEHGVGRGEDLPRDIAAGPGHHRRAGRWCGTGLRGKAGSKACWPAFRRSWAACTCAARSASLCADPRYSRIRRTPERFSTICTAVASEPRLWPAETRQNPLCLCKSGRKVLQYWFL